MSSAACAGGRTAPPLALYIHSPWCVRKCPYCDFNSHAVAETPPWRSYAAQLLADLEQELAAHAARRPLTSIFIGGGTPSLIPGAELGALLEGVRARAELAHDAEITLEANPGTVDAGHFRAYRAAGVTRLSIGVQSLAPAQLTRLGRIHDPTAARSAVAYARAAGFDNLNLDMMFALPGQTAGAAARDLDALIALSPEHISYYQLTLEPNTAFHANPPALPDPDLAADMATQGRERLVRAGYGQYEVSAYARPGWRCRHNLNYWRFGDYLGIGAGAHGKLTDRGDGRVRRTAKLRHPDAYLGAPADRMISQRRVLGPNDLVLEFALNAFRLTEGFSRTLFEETTGLPWSRIAGVLERARDDGMLELRPEWVAPTDLGLAFVDDLVARFLPHEAR